MLVYTTDSKIITDLLKKQIHEDRELLEREGMIDVLDGLNENNTIHITDIFVDNYTNKLTIEYSVQKGTFQ